MDEAVDAERALDGEHGSSVGVRYHDEGT